MTKPTVFNYKNHEELRQAYKELLVDNQQLIADNRTLRKEVAELKQLNDGYVKIIAKNQETNNKLMASVQKQTGGDYISRADAIEAVCDGCVWYKTASCEEGKEEWECSEVNKIRHLPSADAAQGFRGGKIPPKEMLDGTVLIPKHQWLEMERELAELKEKFESADAVQGEWVDWLGNGNEWECSVCKCSIESHGSIAYNYCPMCGARMKGGAELWHE